MNIIMKKIGLVLEGGAQRGIFTAGVTDALMEQRVKLPYVVGVSAGACNAMNYVSGQIGRSRDCMIPTEAERYFGGSELLRQGAFMNLRKVFFEYPVKQYPFDFERYFHSGIESEYVVTAVEDGKPRYFHVNGCRRRLSYVGMASCSMPLISPMVKIDGQLYMDGGISDSIPVKRAFEKGCEKCIIVLTRMQGTYPEVSEGVKKLYGLHYRSYPAFAQALCTRPDLYKAQIELAEALEREGKAFLIRPEITPVSRMEKDQAKLALFYAHGYDQVMRRLPALKAFLAE